MAQQSQSKVSPKRIDQWPICLNVFICLDCVLVWSEWVLSDSCACVLAAVFCRVSLKQVPFPDRNARMNHIEFSQKEVLNTKKHLQRLIIWFSALLGSCDRTLRIFLLRFFWGPLGLKHQIPATGKTIVVVVVCGPGCVASLKHGQSRFSVRFAEVFTAITTSMATAYFFLMSKRNRRWSNQAFKPLVKPRQWQQLTLNIC